MFPKRKRLSRNEFARLLKTGKRMHGPSHTIIFLHADTFKAGVVVSKKTARHATLRNLMRRRVYVVLRDVAPTLPPCHLAILLKPSAPMLPFAMLRTEIVTCIEGITTETKRKISP